MSQLDKTFPTLDCSACILTPKMVDAASNEKITIYTYSEVEKVSGFVGDFTVDIRKKARSVDMSKCTGCGVCQALGVKIVDYKEEYQNNGEVQA